MTFCYECELVSNHYITIWQKMLTVIVPFKQYHGVWLKWAEPLWLWPSNIMTVMDENLSNLFLHLFHHIQVSSLCWLIKGIYKEQSNAKNSKENFFWSYSYLLRNIIHYKLLKNFCFNLFTFKLHTTNVLHWICQKNFYFFSHI